MALLAICMSVEPGKAESMKRMANDGWFRHGEKSYKHNLAAYNFFTEVKIELALCCLNGWRGENLGD
jgi:hypothetical protein